MAATAAQAARIKTATDTLWTRMRNALQHRADITTQGGVSTFLGTTLDGSPDPVPDLSVTQADGGLTALQAVSNMLAGSSEQHRKALLGLFYFPDVAVSRTRSSVRDVRQSLADIRQMMQDMLDASGATAIFDVAPTNAAPNTFTVNAAFLAWLTAEPGIGATLANQIVAGFAAVVAIDATLNAGTGQRRKDLNRLSD